MALSLCRLSAALLAAARTCLYNNNKRAVLEKNRVYKYQCNDVTKPSVSLKYGMRGVKILNPAKLFGMKLKANPI